MHVGLHACTCTYVTLGYVYYACIRQYVHVCNVCMCMCVGGCVVLRAYVCVGACLPVYMFTHV